MLNRYIPLSELGVLKNGYAFKSSSYSGNGNYNVLTIANVTGNRFVSIDCNHIEEIPSDIQKHQILKENDILISLTGNVGRVSLNKGAFNLLNQRVGLFELYDNSLQEYIYQVLSTPQFENAMKNKGQGAAQMNIGKTDIEEFNIPYAENNEILMHIAKVLSLLDYRIQNAECTLQQLYSQKQYLLQQMFI